MSEQQNRAEVLARKLKSHAIRWSDIDEAAKLLRSQAQALTTAKDAMTAALSAGHYHACKCRLIDGLKEIEEAARRLEKLEAANAE